MARGINKVILVGNLGADPEVRHMPSGGQVTNVRLATSETWRDKQSGDQNERTEWHRVVFFGRLAEIAAQYLQKGSQCYIEGSLRTNKWQDQNGQDRFTTEVIAREMQMLGGRGGSGGGYSGSSSDSNDPWDSPEPARNQRPAPAAAAGGGGPSSDFDDDIPF